MSKDTKHNKENADSKQENKEINDKNYKGYVNVNDVSTKKVVIISAVFTLILFLLFVLFPKKPENADGQNAATTESVSESADKTEAANGDDAKQKEDGEAKDSDKKSKDDKKVGMVTEDGKTYIYDKDGVMVKDRWYVYDGAKRYLSHNGVMARDRWVDDKYVDKDGKMLRNTTTPDGLFVDENGERIKHASLEYSKEGLSDLKKELEEYIESTGGRCSVYVKNLDTNEYLVVNNESTYAASEIKMYCAAEVFELIESGDLKYDDNIKRLLSSAVSLSDNDSYNILVGKCGCGQGPVAGMQKIQAFIDENGYKDTFIRTMIVPTSYKFPSLPGGHNMTSVTDCGLFLENIYRKQFINEEMSDEFLNLLKNQNHRAKIPAGLPEGVVCANKTGETDEVQHDAAIVYSDGADYIMTVMSSRGWGYTANIVHMSEMVYYHFNPADRPVEVDEVETEEPEKEAEKK